MLLSADLLAHTDILLIATLTAVLVTAPARQLPVHPVIAVGAPGRLPDLMKVVDQP
jgi:hypothetical protein